LILRRLESNPPKITKLELGGALSQCLALGLLRQAEPARALPCPECDGSRLLTIEFIQNKLTKKNHAYIACPECGPVEIDSEQLERWRVDPVAVAKAALRRLFPTLGVPTEIVPGRLWRIGKVTLAGQPREIFLACGYRTSTGTAVIETLRGRSKSVLLMPSEVGVTRWGSATNNLVLALESLVSVQKFGIELDVGLLESRAADHFGVKTAIIKPKRRAGRVANIEALERELKEHLRTARDHAVTSRDLSGEAKLLPRPTKEELGQRAKVSPSAVTRCFDDEAGAELRLMWEWAADLDRILTFREN